MFRIEITEVSQSADTLPQSRCVLVQEKETLDLPAILRAVNGLGGRKSKGRKPRGVTV